MKDHGCITYIQSNIKQSWLPRNLPRKALFQRFGQVGRPIVDASSITFRKMQVNSERSIIKSVVLENINCIPANAFYATGHIRSIEACTVA